MNQTSLIGRPLAKLTHAVVGFAEKRGVWSGPLTSSSPELARLWGAPPTSTGVSVSEMTALTYSVVWACVNNISTDIGSLPLILYKNLPNGGKEKLTDHKLYRILHDEPNAEMSSMTFRGTLQAHALTWGNGYAEIQRNGGGAVVALWPITPDRVTVKRDLRTQQIYYEVARTNGPSDILPAENMFHIPGLGYDGTVGYNLIAEAREAIALGLATERFGGTFFGGGSTFGGVVSLKENLTEAAKDSFRKQMAAQHQGVDRAHGFLLLGNEASYTSLGVPPNNAQFLETRQHQVEEICRYYRMPPHKVQHLLQSTNNNIEHQGIEYYSDTLRPWCVRWEQEIRRKLIAPSERTIQAAEHKIEGVLRGDLPSRYAAYAVGRQWGWLSANRICELENMDPLPAGQGDIFLVPMNMSPANRLNDIIDKQVAPAPTPAAPVVPPAQRDAEDAAQIVAAVRSALGDVEARIADTTAKIVTAEADVMRWRDASDTFESESLALRAQLTTEQAEASRLRAVLLEATEQRDRLVLEQEAERAAALEVQAQLAQADARMAETSQAHVTAHARAEALQVERDALQAECVASTAQVDALQAEQARALEELQTKTAVERVAAEQRVLELRTLVEEAEQHRDQRIADLGQRDAALADAQAQAVTLTAELDALRTTADQAVEAVKLADADAIRAASAAEDAAAKHAADLAAEQSAKADLERQLADVKAYRETLEAQLAAAKAEADGRAQEAEAARQAAAAADDKRTTAEQTATDHAARIAAEQAAHADTQTALRTARESLIARILSNGTHTRAKLEYATGFWLEKEIERAQRNQGTPGKLLAWAEGFYLLHEENLVDAIRLDLAAHLSMIGSAEDVDVYTRRVVHAQLSQARMQLAAVAQGDPEDFPKAFERLMAKWRRERPKQVVDQLLQEEVAYVRSL